MARTGKIILLNLLVVLGLLFLIEGFLAYFSVGHAILTDSVAERQHTEYDEELGWINLPNLHIPDMYGRNDYFTTNSQRYRSSHDFRREVPKGKMRIVCAGDSFTLGFGVNDDNTWCQLLTEVDNRLETVNMGQGGYGVDQAYLWYKRDRKKLEHHIVLLAFISGDFVRMQSDTFLGYGKPFLTTRQGELFQENFPVPKKSYLRPWLTTDLHELEQLHSVRYFLKPFQKTRRRPELSLKADQQHTEDVAARIFADLHDMSRSKGRFAVLVHLPTRDDYFRSEVDTWGRFVRSEVGENEYLFVDVVEEMRTLPPDRVETLFRQGGHYTAEGNRYVAEVIHRKLSDYSVLSDHLHP